MNNLQKLQASDYATKGIRVKPNPLGLPVSEAQRAFDELSLDIIIPKTNEVIDAVNSFGGNLEGVRVNTENVLEVSTDGTNYSVCGAKGYTIYNKDGAVMPDRRKLKFLDCVVTDSVDTTLVSGIKGDKGDKGDKGNDGCSAVMKDDTTSIMYRLGINNGLLYYEEVI